MSPTLIRNLETKQSSANLAVPAIIAFIGVSLILGVTVGFFTSKLVKGQAAQKAAVEGGVTDTKAKTSAGIPDEKTFKDKAEGTLREGGIEGEGSFHLERPGGDSQNVYLTSSTVDMSPFLGKRVRVWGQTQAAQHAGWFMDVGYIEVLQ